MAKILITGGSGLVGSHLSSLLSQKGHQISHLSRTVSPTSKYPTYHWDISEMKMDERALDGVDYIVHLAGAGVAEGRWTPQRKQEIIDSRVESIRLLHQYASKMEVPLKSFVSASAIGYYGSDTGQQVMHEESPSGTDFLARVVQQWEAEADTFGAMCRVAKVRVGVVLANEGGAMMEILKPIQLYAGAPLGTGHQQVSWIHIHDLVEIFRFVIENELTGTYNATAPNPVTNEVLTEVLAREVGKPLILPRVPAFAMKLLLGEMAQIVLGGSHVSPALIQQKGFKFAFAQLEDAVKDLIG